MAFVRDLYRGDTHFGFVAHRRRWYAASAVALLICILSIALRGFNLGVDFKGGNSLQFPTGRASVSQVESAAGAAGVATESIQQAGSGGQANFVVKTRVLPDKDIAKLKSTLADRLGGEITVKGHPLAVSDISQDQVSASWGASVTRKALVALVVFLVAVTIFISSLFEWRLSVGALAGLLHDLVLAAGVYSIIGFEVTPSTVVGLLTILGYSLYDNIVVYDKVRENTRGILGAGKETYSEAANAAVNQTLARSINTSLIALLPVAGLLFVGAGLLGVGTIKDLALVLFVGLATGAYSSLFLATPIACDLKERQPEYAALRKRVAGRAAAGKSGRQAAKASSASAGRATSAGSVAVLDADSDPANEPSNEPDGSGPEPTTDTARPVPSSTPRPGARAGQTGKGQAGKGQAGKRRPKAKRGGSPQGKRRR